MTHIFASVLEEENFKLSTPTLDDCPDCHDKLFERGGEKICAGCGNKQPILTQRMARSIEFSWLETTPTYKSILAHVDGVSVGVLTLVPAKQYLASAGDKDWVPFNIEVLPNFRRQGIGSALVAQAKRQLPIIESPVQSEDGKKFWPKVAGPALALLPELAGLGAEAGGAGAAAGAEAAEGASVAGGGGAMGGAMGGIGGLMNGAMGRGVAFRAGENIVGGGDTGQQAASEMAGAPGMQPSVGVVGSFEFWAADWAKGKSEPDLVQCASCASLEMNGTPAPENCEACKKAQTKTATQDTFGEDSVGLGTKNRGDNSDPDQQSSSGADTKERGDAPEQLKDVGTGDAKGNPNQSDGLEEQHGGHSELQDSAMKAFHTNLPLIIEFANSEESGEDHPLLKALDQVLEEAFPGYRKGEEGAHGSENPTEKLEGELGQDLDDDGEVEGKDSSEHINVGDFAREAGQKIASTDYAFENPVPWEHFELFCKDQGWQIDKVKDGLVVYDEDSNCMHVYQDQSGAVIAVERFGNNNPDTIVSELDGAFGPLHDEYSDEYQEMMSDPPCDNFLPYEDPESSEFCQNCENHKSEHDPQTVIGGDPTDPRLAGDFARKAADGYPSTPFRTRQWQCPQCENWDYEYAGNRGGLDWHNCQNCGYQEKLPTDYNRRQAPEGWDEENQGVYDYDDWEPMERHAFDTGMMPGGVPQAVPGQAAWPNQQIEQQNQAGSCEQCGQSHIPGTPCPTADPALQQPGAAAGQAQQNLAPLAVGVQRATPPAPQKVMTHTEYTHMAAEVQLHDELDHSRQKNDDHHDRRYEDGPDDHTGWYEDWEGPEEGKGGGHPWVDEEKAPLEEGQDYELHSTDYEVPDKITVDSVTPDKLIFTIHSGDIDYQDELTKEDVHTMGYTFTKGQDIGTDSESGFDMQDDDPIRPGQDSGAQVTDLSIPSSKVSGEVPDAMRNQQAQDLLGWSAQLDDPNKLMTFEEWQALADKPDHPANSHVPARPINEVDPRSGEVLPPDDHEYYGSFQGDIPDSRDWLNESSEVEVDPQMMARLAGKDFSPREQREFIDEDGTARNLHRMNIEHTHYEEGDDYGDTLWQPW